MLVRVATVRTSFKIEDFIDSLIKAWYEQYGSNPIKSQIAVIYAQWGLETGLGAFCWNNNIGNIKAFDVPGTTVEYCALNGVWEIINGKRIVLSSEDPGAWFRSFRTLDLGVAHHIDLLRNRRYKTAWLAVEQGNPAQFAHLLKQQGYYTAPEADYIKAMQYYFNKFMNDTIFERVINALNINFPSDYKPVNISIFDTITDTVVKPDHPTFTTNIFNKIRNILHKVT